MLLWATELEVLKCIMLRCFSWRLSASSSLCAPTQSMIPAACCPATCDRDSAVHMPKARLHSQGPTSVSLLRTSIFWHWFHLLVLQKERAHDASILTRSRSMRASVGARPLSAAIDAESQKCPVTASRFRLCTDCERPACMAWRESRSQ